jgi:hypothetical protein
MAQDVPEVYRGLWRRRLIQTPAATDRTTTVYWLQTASLFGDVRIPANRVGNDLRALARQQGFAGCLEVAGDTLSWRRWLDYQPPAAPDVARVHFSGDVLVEQGIHAEYREEWERVQPADPDTIALSLQAERDARGRECSRSGVLVASGEYFVLALDRQHRLPPASDLGELIDSTSYTDEEKAAFLDCTIDFGVRREKDIWRVQHSTQPHNEGEALQTLYGAWYADGPEHFLQYVTGGVRRRWRVVELGPAFSGLPR